MSFLKGHSVSSEVRKKISIGLMGNKHTLGRKQTNEAKEKIRRFFLGKKRSKNTIEKMRKSMLGKKHSEETKLKMRESAQRGEKNVNWKGGVTDEARYRRERRLRQYLSSGSHNKYQWELVKAWFNDTCLCCGKTGLKLTEDHVIPLSKGGTDYISNIQPLCLTCNLRKFIKNTDYRIKYYV